MKHPIAVLISDIHLSHLKPICYAQDLDWYSLMEYYLEQLRAEANEKDIPVIFAGDLFDKWNAPAELINFAIQNLPYMYGIPGQHDIPHHNFELLNKSAWSILELAECIEFVNRERMLSSNLMIHPVQWGESIDSVRLEKNRCCQLLLTHKYIWTDYKNSYPNAPKENMIGAYKKALSSYDAALFGDNHKGFLAKAGKCHVLNNGAMMRRKSDEINYQPCYGLLYKDGSIERVPFDTSRDVFDSSVLDVEINQDIDLSFISKLRDLKDRKLDFESEVKHIVDSKVYPDSVNKIIIRLIEDE